MIILWLIVLYVYLSPKNIIFVEILNEILSMPKNWFPLESNPSVMNEYVHNLGLDTTQFSFQDVLSTEEWALEMIPQPAVAVIMLFPVKESSESYLQQEADKILSEGQYVDPSVYYMKQTVGNACGTVGILHAAANARPHVNITPGSFLEKFFQDTSSMSPEQIASFLEQDDEIESHHVVAAEAGQSAQDADPDTHFICFSHVNGHIYELDGRKKFPINHGTSSPENLLQDACRVIREFMERDPGELRFTILALAPTAEE